MMTREDFRRQLYSVTVPCRACDEHHEDATCTCTYVMDLLDAIDERDARIAELERERDALRQAVKTAASAAQTLVRGADQRVAEAKKHEPAARVAINTLESEREMNAILTGENEQLRQQLARAGRAIESVLSELKQSSPLSNDDAKPDALDKELDKEPGGCASPSGHQTTAKKMLAAIDKLATEKLNRVLGPDPLSDGPPRAGCGAYGCEVTIASLRSQLTEAREVLKYIRDYPLTVKSVRDRIDAVLARGKEGGGG